MVIVLRAFEICVAFVVHHLLRESVSCDHSWKDRQQGFAKISVQVYSLP
jgi:hypothetical protein